MSEMTQAKLLGTTDGQVWAQEFNDVLAKQYNLRVDEGWLISWFANAIEAGRSAGLLTARSEGFREGVEAAAWAIGELDGGDPERERALDDAIATVRALTPPSPNDGGERG